MAVGPTTTQSPTTRRLDAQRGAKASTGKSRAPAVVRGANAANDAVFTLVLMIKHPDADPAEITRSLGIKPTSAHPMGAPRVGARGQSIGGVYPTMTWAHRAHFPARKRVSDALAEYLHPLVAATTTVRKIVETGGRVSLFFNMPASHRGEMFEVDHLAAIAKLGINLGFEIFPDWDGKPLANDLRGK